mgnify:CR=1 FL=1
MAEKLYLAGHKGRFMTTPLAAFPNRQSAQTWADSANRWYGEGHPLHPVTAWPNDILHDPHPFPDPNGSIEDIFKDIDK